MTVSFNFPQKSENLEPEVDPKLFDGSDPVFRADPDFGSDDYEAEILKKKLGKLDLTIKAENEVYPKDAPYTQGDKFKNFFFFCHCRNGQLS
jgi:hypothetical protein